MNKIKHLVLIEFKLEINNKQKEDISNEFIKLIENCLLEGNKYILKISGGKNNSKEGINKGFEYGFVITFDSIIHRNFYCDIDSVHSSFKDQLAPLIKEVLVLDFEEGSF